MGKKVGTLLFSFVVMWSVKAQDYPKGYFRHPLNIPMQLVANFGEIRANHWHMGLDIRTQQKVNLPVYAAADGWVSRIKVEPGGFGQAIYISHPNGYTTLYAHLNKFFPVLDRYVIEKQYQQQTWAIDLEFSPDQFPLSKGDLIALSGSTGGSAGPHVHFEIRDTKEDNVLNPLLFGFPLPDKVPPTVTRIALYDRNRSTYQQSPKLYTVAGLRNSTLKVSADKISFAIGATDRIGGSNNGIYAARILLDGRPVSSFVLDRISYDDTRYINAQIDYPFDARGGASLQHLTPLPGASAVAYNTGSGDGVLLLPDQGPHAVVIEVQDAAGNTTRVPFSVQYDGSPVQVPAVGEQLLPNQVNVFERDDFQLVTTDQSIYDTVAVSYNVSPTNAAGAVSPVHSFLSQVFPTHDAVTVRIRPTADIPEEWRDRIVIRSVSGTKTIVAKATWQKGWLMARFRQFGTYQAFVDNVPPVINAVPSNLAGATRVVITPTDNFNSIKSFRAELDGNWLRFTNDKGRTWIYVFDERFPRGEHELKVRVEDEAGNVTERTWTVRR